MLLASRFWKARTTRRKLASTAIKCCLVRHRFGKPRRQLAGLPVEVKIVETGQDKAEFVN